jgi:AcrR family transcriptional regulator
LEAAGRVFIQKGFTGASMQDIAHEAGLSAGNIYRYFVSKEALIAAVAEDCQEKTQAFFEAEARAAPSALAAVRAIGEEYWAKSNTQEFRDHAMLSLETYLVGARDAGQGKVVRSSVRATQQALAELLGKARDAGELDERVAPQALAAFLHALAMGLESLSVQLGDEFDPSETWNLLTDVLGRLGPARAGGKER